MTETSFATLSFKTNESKSDANHLQSEYLFDAIREGDIQEIQSCLTNAPRQIQRQLVNQIDDDELTPLHLACRYSDGEVAKILLTFGAFPNMKGHEGKQPIHLAARFYKRKKRTITATGDPVRYPNSVSKNNCLQLLLKHGADVNARDNQQATPLHYAAEKGQTEAVQILLGCVGIVTHARDANQSTPLHKAASNGHAEVVDLLLKASRNLSNILNAKDANGATALLLACRKGCIKTAEFLLQASSTTSPGGVITRLLLSDEKGSTCLHAAVESGHTEMVKYLLNKWDEESISFYSRYNYSLCDKKLVDLKRNEGFTAIHLAADNGDPEMLNAIISKEPNINPTCKLRQTPLLLAAEKGHLECTRILLSNGCETEISDNTRTTPFLSACKRNNLLVVKCFLDHGVDVCAVDSQLKNCLLLAAETGRDSRILEALLSVPECKELWNDTDQFGNTPMHEASARGYITGLAAMLYSGMSLDTRNDLDQTPLHVAAANNRVTVVNYIVAEERARLNDRDKHSRTPFLLAAWHGHIETLNKLIELGANTNDSDTCMWTALHMCAADSRLECAQALLIAEPRLIYSRTRQQETALHLTCTTGEGEMVRLLMENGADVKERLPDGRNALDIAIESDKKSCALAIIESENWQEALKNVTISDETGFVSTPMRKMIKSMPEVAEIVLSKCITCIGSNADDKHFEVEFNYEFLEDTYNITSWNGGRELVEDETEENNLFINYDKPYKLVDNKDMKLKKVADNPKKKKTGEENFSKILSEEPSRLDLDASTVNLSTQPSFDEVGKLQTKSEPYCENSAVLYENHPLNIMVTSKRETLLRHPTVISLLNYKWSDYGNRMFLLNVIGYIIYAALLNAYMLSTPPRFAINVTLTQEGVDQGLRCIRVIKEAEDVWGTSCQDNSPFRYVTTALIFVFAAIQLFKEIIQIIYQRLAYFADPVNYMELTLYSLSILVFVDTDPLAKDTGIRERWQWECGAFLILLSWLNLLLYIRRTPLGIYVLMLASVSISFLRFGIIMFFFLFGFSFSFYVLLQNQYPFYTPITTCVKTVSMMLGEFDYASIFLNHFTSSDYQDIVQYKSSTYVIFVVFVFSMSLLMTNLLIGIAVGDIATVQDQATLRRLANQINGALDLEFALPSYLRRRMVVQKRRMNPRKHFRRNVLAKLFLPKEKITLKQLIDLFHKQQILDKSMDSKSSANSMNQITKVAIENMSVRQHAVEEKLNMLLEKFNELSGKIEAFNLEKKRISPPVTQADSEDEQM